jgi:hypothetical protein
MAIGQQRVEQVGVDLGTPPDWQVVPDRALGFGAFPLIAVLVLHASSAQVSALSTVGRPWPRTAITVAGLLILATPLLLPRRQPPAPTGNGSNRPVVVDSATRGVA